MMEFICEVCGVRRTELEGAGAWFTVGINDYGPPEHRNRKLNVYAWPLGRRSQQDDQVLHGCSVSCMLNIVSRWAQPPREKGAGQ